MSNRLAGALLSLALLGCRMGGTAGDSQVGSVNSSAVNVDTVRSFVQSKLRAQKAADEPLHSYEGHCLEFASLWHEFLNGSGFVANLQQTQGVYYPVVSGQGVQRSATHYFVAINAGTQDEILIDPTYGQFFSEAQRQGLQPIFVGKRQELSQLYRQNSKKLRMVVSYDEHTGRYDAGEVVEMIYSFGSHSKNRSSF
jgi:hypothetical protein